VPATRASLLTCTVESRISSGRAPASLSTPGVFSVRFPSRVPTSSSFPRASSSTRGLMLFRFLSRVSFFLTLLPFDGVLASLFCLFGSLDSEFPSAACLGSDKSLAFDLSSKASDLSSGSFSGTTSTSFLCPPPFVRSGVSFSSCFSSLLIFSRILVLSLSPLLLPFCKCCTGAAFRFLAFSFLVPLFSLVSPNLCGSNDEPLAEAAVEPTFSDEPLASEPASLDSRLSFFVSSLLRVLGPAGLEEIAG